MLEKNRLLFTVANRSNEQKDATHEASLMIHAYHTIDLSGSTPHKSVKLFQFLFDGCGKNNFPSYSTKTVITSANTSDSYHDENVDKMKPKQTE